MYKLFLLVCFAANVFVDSIPLNNPVIKGYIIDGIDTEIEEAPYQIALFHNKLYVCGGFIVSPTHIVTAHQCFYHSGGYFWIRAGSTIRSEGGVTAKVKTIHKHPKFDRFVNDYNVVVVELDTPLKLNNKTMKAAKLATKEPTPGSVALVTGWGGVDDEGEPIEILRSGMMPIYNRTLCAEEYEDFDKEITPRMICAGDGEVVCARFDEGNPLVYKNEVVGIFSFGPRWDQDDDTAGVYTNIANPEITKFIKDIAKV